MQSKATSPEAYINELPEDRKGPIRTLDTLIRKHMPKDLEAGILSGIMFQNLLVQMGVTVNRFRLCHL